MTLLDQVMSKGREMHAIARQYDISNLRVFGSVARREENKNSDIDILVDAGPRCTLLSIGGMIADLEDLFGRQVDIRTLGDLHPKMRARVLAEAVSV